MAYGLLFEIVRDISARVDLAEPIVEFGSMQVEPGQPNDLRRLFPGRDFTGTDMRDGPGVDRVEDLRRLTFADGEVGTALCLETLEHCADPWAACKEMHRVLEPDGGICLVSSVMLMGIHAHPSDYWRFTPEGLRLLLQEFDDVDVAYMGDPAAPFFVYGLGRKGGSLDFRLSDLPALARAQAEYERAEGELRIGPFRYTVRQLASQLRRELPRVLRERTRARTRAGA